MARPDIVSPCIKVCAVDGETSLCLGCGRNKNEIVGLMKFEYDGRNAIMDLLPERLEKLRGLGKLEDVR